jgi:drug/metabolite transporter (DMT)-like permease
MSKNLKGFLLVFFGALCFSTKAIMIKLAYQLKVDPVTLLTLRMAFSLPFFIVVALVNNKQAIQEPVSKRDLVKIIGLGLLGYYTASIMDFMGLQYISAGLERLILFIYPTIVVLISFFFYKKPITRTIILALLLTYTGVAIVFLDDMILSKDGIFIGASLIFGSAITYALYLVGTERLIPRIGSVRFTAFAMIVSSIAVLIQFAVMRPVDITALSTDVYIYGFAIAIIATVIPTFMITEGINQIGAGRASIIASVGPITTITMEYFILDEPLTSFEVFGTIFVMTGVLMVSMKKS